MIKNFLLLVSCMLLGCAHDEDRVSSDVVDQKGIMSEYGYSPTNPIKVGDGDYKNGAQNEREFLYSLSGPNGESVAFKRLGSCCAFETTNGFLGSG